MKTRTWILIASLLFMAGLISSCKMEEDELTAINSAGRFSPAVYHATIEGTAATKVYADEQLHVLWNAEDEITIFDKTTRNKKFRFLGADGATGGDFEEVSAGYGAGSELGYSYAVYPYDANTGYVYDDIISTTFPRVQSYKAGSFGRGANLMVAKSTTTDLTFRNVGGYLCLRLYGVGFSVRSIILQGNADETLSGPVKISFGAQNVPSMVFDPSNTTAWKKEIVLKPDAPVALGATAETAVSFWMVLPPTTFTSGFTVTIIDSMGGVHVKKASKEFDIQRNTLLTMKAFALTAVEPSPVAQGIHFLSDGDYTFDRTTDQVNIVESGGNAWARFLLMRSSDLVMYELGPVPADAVVGTTFDAALSVFENGALTGTPREGRFIVSSLSGGMMNLVTDEGDRYVFRF